MNETDLEETAKEKEHKMVDEYVALSLDNLIGTSEKFQERAETI